jgi:hypothetical protein
MVLPRPHNLKNGNHRKGDRNHWNHNDNELPKSRGDDKNGWILRPQGAS